MKVTHICAKHITLALSSYNTYPNQILVVGRFTQLPEVISIIGFLNSCCTTECGNLNKWKHISLSSKWLKCWETSLILKQPMVFHPQRSKPFNFWTLLKWSFQRSSKKQLSMTAMARGLVWVNYKAVSSYVGFPCFPPLKFIILAGKPPILETPYFETHPSHFTSLNQV